MMKKIYTAIAKDHLESSPHTWTKGLDYQMVENNDRIKLASNEGDTGYDVSKRPELAELFEITEGWNPF